MSNWTICGLVLCLCAVIAAGVASRNPGIAFLIGAVVGGPTVFLLLEGVASRKRGERIP